MVTHVFAQWGRIPAMKRVPESVKKELCVRFRGDPSSLRFLGGGRDWSDGVLFTFTPASDAAPTEMVLKILEFRKEDTEGLARAEDRIRLVRGFGQNGARIVLPLPSRDGLIFETADKGDRVFMAYVYALAPGRPVERRDRIAHTGGFYRAMGDVLGRMHAVSETRPETLSPDGTSDAAGSLRGWRGEWESFRSWCKDDEVGSAWERLREALELLPVDKSGYGFVHNDAHAWNLLFDPDSKAVRSGQEPEFTVIDFDCANYHWYMADSAIALYSTLVIGGGGFETESGPPAGFRDKVFAAFWEGYRRHREPTREWLDRLDLFLQYRRCMSFMPFQEQTAKHPAWRSRWKQRIIAENARLFGRE
jgi:Ser/Thr protein kinase RdoA (MazF antagonist)